MTHTEPKSGLDFRGARYLISAPSLKHCPPDCAREAAFMGRSNAGKSSAINALTGQTGLARTSKTPGRTQLLNYFELAPERYLVDLPGFGYAKVPPAMKRQWQTQIELYLRERRSLCGLVLLMDIRHPFRDYDMQMIEWARQAGLPLHVLLTKSDKLSRGAAKAALLQARRTLAEYGDRVTVQLFSSLKAEGVPELKRMLNDWLCPREADDRQGAAEVEKEEEREVPDGEGELFDPPNESEP